MIPFDPLFLTLSCFLIGIFLGIILYRGDYCLVAMLRDFFLVRDLTLFRSFVLYLVVVSTLFTLGKFTGLITIFPPRTFGPVSLATIIGGFIFGIGMVLAGGCVIGTLYKMAGGNLTNWLAFAGIIAGSMLYAEVHPFVRRFSSKTEFITPPFVVQASPMFELFLLTILILSGSILLILWMRKDLLNTSAHARGYLQPWKTALALALANMIYYMLTGAPMGVTTAYAKIASYTEKLLIPDHLARLIYFREKSVSWAVGGKQISGGAGPVIDYISYTELALILGVFAGAFITSLYYKEFKIYGLPPKKQIAAALIGGIFLALGARIAAGCNVKFFLGGLPLLAFQSFFFIITAVAGVFVGTKILTRFILR